MFDGVVYSYDVNDGLVVDFDGDGQYELIVKWQFSNVYDNLQCGYIGFMLLDVYKFDGMWLWCIDFGFNICVGVYYISFVVYDFDGDGCVEVMMKMVDGMVDGIGQVIGDVWVDYCNVVGYVFIGLEFLIVFDGCSGVVLVIVFYVFVCGDVVVWGDVYGN